MSLDNFREYGALILLFRACHDEELKREVVRLIPEIAAWDEPVEPAPRWVLTAKDGEDMVLGREIVICREVDLPSHEAKFRDNFDLAGNVTVSVRKVPEPVVV